MGSNIYGKLRARIDQYTMGMNSTRSGIEIEILKKIFTEDEALIYLNLAEKLETADVIAEHSGIDVARSAQILDGMTSKGIVFSRNRNGMRYYSAAPLMRGIFENSALTSMDSNLAKMFDRYVENGFTAKGFFFRVLPVNIIADNSGCVLPEDDVREIIMRRERIGLLKCSCRKKMDLLGSRCSSPAELCIGFDFYAEFVIEELGEGRWISKSEAIDLLKQSERGGLVHQGGVSADGIEFICNCCPECCIHLKIINRIEKPSSAVSSGYLPRAVPGLCFECNTCRRRCPVDAIRFNENGMVADLDRCIGCGICVTSCAAGAIELYRINENGEGGVNRTGERILLRSSAEFDGDVE